jgi:hypothetical protein
MLDGVHDAYREQQSRVSSMELLEGDISDLRRVGAPAMI